MNAKWEWGDLCQLVGRLEKVPRDRVLKKYHTLANGGLPGLTERASFLRSALEAELNGEPGDSCADGAQEYEDILAGEAAIKAIQEK